MNTMKKILSVLLVLVMVLSMSTMAFAAVEYTITVNNTNENVTIDGMEYSAYKVFEATYNEATGTISYSYNSNTCINVAYDHDNDDSTAPLSGESLLEWLGAYDGEQPSDESVRDFADYVYKTYVETGAVTPTATGTDEGESVTINTGSAGYYLVYGKGKGNGKDGETVTAAVALTSTYPTAEVNPKFDAPSLEKQIKHNEHNTWGVVGDNQIGDTVEFRTITTVPNPYGYDTYEYIIHDTMSEGLTLQEGFTVKVNDQVVLDDSYLSLVNTDGHSCTFELKIDILNAIEDGVLEVGDQLYTYYNATLNDEALIYDEGKQDNKAYLEYSNNPYDDDTTITEEDIVYDWTFKMAVNKIDADNNALTGAIFVLSENGNIDVKDLNVNENGVPSVTAGLIGLVKDGDVYRVATAEDTNVVYVIEAGNPKIKGLDDATNYYLYETKAPAGYNLLKDPIKFVISASYSLDGSTLETGNPVLSVEGEQVNNMTANVVNNSGFELPTTGGMGTTLFYIVGGLLVAVAVVMLVTKKRMNDNE